MQVNNVANSTAYTVRRSKRARHLRLSVYCDGRIVLTAPWSAESHTLQQFLEEKRAWVADKVRAFRSAGLTLIRVPQRNDYARRKEEARTLVHERIAYFAPLLGVSPGQIRIKNQKRCWGSCSKQGNININYKILYLPPALQDYIIVHELCHLKELNHSRRFWSLVASLIPDYRAVRATLRKFRFTR